SEASTRPRLARRKAGVPRAISSGAGGSPDISSFVLFEGAQGEGGNAGVLDQTAPAQIRQVDDGGGLVDLRAQLIDQLRGGEEGAAGGDQIIHQQHLGAVGEGIAIDRKSTRL